MWWIQIVHKKGFFPSWTASVCILKEPLWPNFSPHWVHWKGLIFSWTVAIWFLNLKGTVKLLPHMVHKWFLGVSLKSLGRIFFHATFFPSWAEAIWASRYRWHDTILPHFVQWYVFFQLWTSTLCALNFSLSLKFSPQSGQVWGMCNLLICSCKSAFEKAFESHCGHWKSFIFSWTCFTCFFNLLLWTNVDPHNLHLKGLSTSWTEDKCFIKALCNENPSLQIKQVYFDSYSFLCLLFVWACRAGWFV